MILIRKILLVASLVLILIATDVQNSWAISVSVQRPVIMNLFGNHKAATKDLEGKTQESFGKITGNKNDQATGKAKQLESKADEFAQNVQDTVDNVAHNIKKES